MNQSLDNIDQLPPEVADLLPDEIAQMLRIAKEKRQQQIDDLGIAIAKKRDEAVKARSSSGLEEEWMEDEEAYQGIDDANRSDAKAYKPDSPNGSALFPRKDPSRSTVFMNITRPYCDAAAAKVGDMLLPTDDRNWAIRPTPIPQLDEKIKASIDQQSRQAEQMPQAVPGMAPGMPPGQVGPIAKDPQVELAQRILDDAKRRAEAAEKQIDDWLVESLWHGEVRKMIEDCARIGTGILKGPLPVKRKYKSAVNEGGQMTLKMSVEIAPGSSRVDPWNFFPDPACGENIHNGSYVLEKDQISVRKLRDFKGLPGYIAEAIDKVIEEGPDKKFANEGRLNPHSSKNYDDEKYTIWYYYGIVEREDLEAMGVDVDDHLLDGVPSIVTLINDTPIKAVLNPLDSGEYPYDVMPWQRRLGSWAGVGICRQGRTPQRMLNAATRNMMDNAGISAGPQIVIWKNKIVPADGNWAITPRKIWFAKEDADIKGVADAFASFAIDSRQAELSNIIQFALKMMEDVTGMPMLMQGQQGKAPDTVGGMQILNNNASTVLRRIARQFDDYITEPHIRRYYEWLMMYSEEEGQKGDYIIDARGSSALVERDIQNQAVMGLVQLAVPGNPYGLDPKRTIAEALKAQKLDPKKFTLSDEEQEQLAAQMQPPPMPQLEVAKIRADADLKKTQMAIQSDEKIAQMEAEIDQLRIQKDTDRDTVYVQSEQQRNASEHDARLRELDMKLQLAQLDYASKHQIKLEDVKAKLADTAMKLRTQKELAGASIGADLHKHSNPQVIKPAVEPRGRAAPGQAFTQ